MYPSHGWGVSQRLKKVPPSPARADKQAEDGSLFLPLYLDAAWLTRAGAAAPLQLRGGYFLDLATFIPVARFASLDVAMTTPPALATHDGSNVTDAMRNGPRPAFVDAMEGEGGKLLLVHGYCARETPYVRVLCLEF